VLPRLVTRRDAAKDRLVNCGTTSALCQMVSEDDGDPPRESEQIGTNKMRRGVPLVVFLDIQEVLGGLGCVDPDVGQGCTRTRE
jgi:hypothetical protein